MPKSILYIILLVNNIIYGNEYNNILDIFVFKEYIYNYKVGNIKRVKETIKDENKKELDLIEIQKFNTKSKIRKAIKKYEKVKVDNIYDQNKQAMSMYLLSYCYYGNGEYSRCKDNIDSCILKTKDEELRRKARKLKLNFGMDSIYDNWKLQKSDHFIFHFQDSIKFERNKIINRIELGFDSINKYFDSNLPKKIDYFIWSNEKLFTNKLSKENSFSNPYICLTHDLYYKNYDHFGHEMTHSIINYSIPIKIQNKLILEGVCTYFDMSERNYIYYIKKRWIENISIIEIWKDPRIANNNLIYPLGAELTKRIVLKFGMKKFIKYLKNQSYENAKKVFGIAIDQLIYELEKEIWK